MNEDTRCALRNDLAVSLVALEMVAVEPGISPELRPFVAAAVERLFAAVHRFEGLQDGDQLPDTIGLDEHGSSAESPVLT